jgi:cytochrome c-type biogenesis protein CcmF
MIPEIGYSTLITASFIYFFLLLTPFCLKLGGEKRAYNLVCILSALSFIFVSFSFASLIYSHIVSDFSVVNVLSNSHTAKPLIYKISGTWGNHEGSMLLWVWLLSLITILFIFFSQIDLRDKCYIIVPQSFIILGFLLFIILTSNPFIRIFPRAKEGLGLNPLLQDIGLAIHPPFLYLGYVSFSIAFSAALYALFTQHFNKDFVKKIKPWLLFAWSCLTIGIGLGSWWAYRELGWGGFWFWDPVENSSLMPWLFGTALIHSLIVTEKRDSLKKWTILLSLLTFSLSLLATFIVRSGIVTSVHNFANDPERGLFILIYLIIVTGSGLLTFAWKAHTLKNNDDGFELASKETAILFNNLLLFCACLTIMLGTLAPIFYDAFLGEKLSIGAPYYHITFLPFVLAIVLLCVIGSTISWRNDNLNRHKKIWLIALAASIIFTSIGILLNKPLPFFNIIFIFLGLYLTFTLLLLIIQKLKIVEYNVSKLSSEFIAMIFAHLGLALIVISISLMNATEDEVLANISVGEQVKIANYNLTLKDIKYDEGPNYFIKRAIFYLRKANIEIAHLKPEIRAYPIEKSETTESAVVSNNFANIYVTIGHADVKDKITVRVYYKPMMDLIWYSVLLMAIGGLINPIKRVMKRI